ncbi:ribosomal protein S6 [Saccharata proteae CBS 121410]|uniref:Small ribosomal subunit protein bS6m n=1 Tax=Saccharata proteae CBS 121410 TaxID=1314787 RepID=A0A9P4HXZ5_9PEZI|nr:ribosomal protein S6 [Saccharata proteae CBS 121410]
MLYELIGIVRPGKINEVKEIAKVAGTIVLSSGGVVRGVTNWGIYQLPTPYRKHQASYSSGHHFIMRFDSSARTQHAIRRTMGLDPRLLRFSVVKLGSKLEEIADVPGIAPWGRNVEDKRSFYDLHNH